jgi:hypothetical protein
VDVDRRRPLGELRHCWRHAAAIIGLAAYQFDTSLLKNSQQQSSSSVTWRQSSLLAMKNAMSWKPFSFILVSVALSLILRPSSVHAFSSSACRQQHKELHILPSFSITQLVRAGEIHCYNADSGSQSFQKLQVQVGFLRTTSPF